MTNPTTLPAVLVAVLNEVGQKLHSGESVGELLPQLKANLFTLPPESVAGIATHITKAAGLYRRHESLAKQAGWWRRLSDFFLGPRKHGEASRRAYKRKQRFGGKLTPEEQLAGLPDLAYLFIFHGDGRLREAALRLIDTEILSPFIFASLALRLNDWAAPVRAAAFLCAERCFPLTKGSVVATATFGVLAGAKRWQRWTGERAILDATFARQDVGAEIATALTKNRTGPAAGLLRLTLKYAAIDAHLEGLALSAAQPSVRAVALQTIVEQKARWQTGWGRQWIDKTMGQYRTVRTFAERPLATMPVSLSLDLLRKGAADKSALVRKTALAALIRHYGGNPHATEVAAKLTEDRSRSVRERASFIVSGRGFPT